MLREQGLKGNSYRILFGDVKDMAEMSAKAKAKPMDFTNDIVPRVMPFIYKTVNTYGMFQKILNMYGFCISIFASTLDICQK